MSDRVTNLDEFKQGHSALFGGASMGQRRSKRDPDDGTPEETEAKPSAATRMAALGLQTAHELFHTLNGEAFVTLKDGDVYRHYSVQGSDYAEHLARLNYLRYGTAPAADAVRAAVNIVAGEAKYAGDEHPVYARIAHYDGAVWIDLGDETWRAVEIRPGIEPHGYRVVDSVDVPVKFRRLRSSRPLPAPQPGGSIEQLRSLFLLEDDEWMLLVGWLIGAYQDAGGRALLELIGQQGAGKSTLARFLISLIDPSDVSLRSMARSEEDLLIGLQARAVLGYDNVSTFHPEIADALCRVSTGGGIGKRKLYSDAEETHVKAQVPVLWTSIVPAAINRPDLQDRTVTIRLEPLVSETYRTERDVNAAFEAIGPGILGALYSVVAMGLKRQDMVHLDRLPRLADFATWVEAAAPALGWAPGDFSAALAASRMMASHMAVDASPVGRLVLVFMRDRTHWEGPVSALLIKLREVASDDDRRQPQFPKDSARLGIQLRRIQRPLEDVGITVGFGRSRQANVITLHRNDRSGEAVMEEAAS